MISADSDTLIEEDASENKEVMGCADCSGSESELLNHA